MSTSWSGQKPQIYKASFATLCAGSFPLLLSAVEGQTVCDIGCGCGTLTRTLTHAGYAVTAVDAEPTMVELARQECADLPVTPTVSCLPQLEGVPTAHYDTAIANFVLNHVADPVAALTGMSRIVKPGGRILATVWSRNMLYRDIVMQEITRVVKEQALPAETILGTTTQQHDSSMDMLRSATGLHALCEQAQLTDIAVTEPSWQWTIPWKVFWSGVAGGLGHIGTLYQSLPDDVQQIVHDRVRQACADYLTDDTLTLPCDAIMLSARTNDRN